MKLSALISLVALFIVSDTASGQTFRERRQARIRAMAPPQTVVVFNEYRLPSGQMIGLAEWTEPPVPVIVIPPRQLARRPLQMSREPYYAIDPRYYGADCANGQCRP